MTILQLPAYNVLKVDSTEHDYHIVAESVEPRRSCPHCQSENTVGFGRREQLVKDLPVHGKRVGIYVDTRRFQCRACNRTFFERLPDVDERRAMTTRLVKWIGQQSLKRTFTSIAEEVGITEGTVRLIFKDFVADAEKGDQRAPPGGALARRRCYGRPRPGGGMSTTHRSPLITRPCSALEYVDETPRRPRRSEAEALAEAELGHHFVTLLALDRAVPRGFADQRGVWPVWVEANADWRQAGAIFDRNQWAARAVRLEVMAVASGAHAARLKAALDEALGGREGLTDADPLRHRFRNAIDFGPLETWWGAMLSEAVAICELGARGFEVFGRAEHEARVAVRVQAAAARRIRGG